MSTMRMLQGLAHETWSVLVSRMRSSNIGDSGNDLPEHTETSATVVSGDVVCDKPETGSECSRASESFGAKKL